MNQLISYRRVGTTVFLFYLLFTLFLLLLMPQLFGPLRGLRSLFIDSFKFFLDLQTLFLLYFLLSPKSLQTILLLFHFPLLFFLLNLKCLQSLHIPHLSIILTFHLFCYLSVKLSLYLFLCPLILSFFCRQHIFDYLIVLCNVCFEVFELLKTLLVVCLFISF